MAWLEQYSEHFWTFQGCHVSNILNMTFQVLGCLFQCDDFSNILCDLYDTNFDLKYHMPNPDGSHNIYYH